MKLKQLAKKLGVGLLGLTTALSISTQAFAVKENANNNDGGVNAWDSDLPGYNNTNDYGWRVSLVDDSGKLIKAADLDSGGLFNNSGNYYKSTGSDPSSGNTVPQNGTIPSGMPAPMHWTGNSFEGNGGATRDYLLDDSSGKQNVVTIAKDNFPTVDKLEDKLEDGSIQVVVEPVFNLPSYTNLPVGETRPGGLKVVSGTDSATGVAYNYWAYPDGSPYFCVGTMRDYIQNEIRTYGGGSIGGFVSPIVKQALKSFFLANDAFGLSAPTEEELDAYIEDYILHGDLSKLGIGMYIYSNLQTPVIPVNPTPTPQNASITITESSITKRENIANLTGSSLSTHNFKWKADAFDNVSCHDKRHESQGYNDSSNRVNVEQSIQNGEAEGVIENWSHMTDGAGYTSQKFVRTKTRNTTGVWEYNINGAGYCIVVIRKDDTVDLIDYRKTGNEGIIDNISNTVVQTNNKASRGRAANGSYSFNVSLVFELDTGKWGYDDSTQYKHEDSHYYSCNNSGCTICPKHVSSSTRTSTTTSEFDTSTQLPMTVKVNWDVYAGLPNSGDYDKTSKGLTQHTSGSKTETWLEIPMQNGLVSLHPYIRMMFDTPTQTKIAVNVAGQYERKFLPNEYVGVIYETSQNNTHNVVNSIANKNTKGALLLSSEQWSTHATAKKMTNKSSCVLPGGATLDLTILSENRQKFTVEAYTPILAGSGLKQVQATGSSSLANNASSAISSYKDFLSEVTNSLEHLSVQQWVTKSRSPITDADKLKNITTAVWSMANAQKANPSANTDSKYYFRDDTSSNGLNSSANEGDLDVKTGATTSKYYTFFINTKGELRCKEADSLNSSATIGDPYNDGKLVLAKDKGVSSLTGIYKTINNKTHIITKLLNAFERNTGSDTSANWVSDGKWYNEAFDGITILYQSTTLELGFKDTAVRTSVLDPALTPSSSSKSDLFTKYSLSQFKMKDTCSNQTKAGMLAKYKGNEFITDSKKLSEIFISDIFYIPNATVQDLR